MSLADDTVVACDVTWLRSPLARMKGLVLAPPLRPGAAVVLDGAAQVHTCGVSAPLDVVFCDRDWVVLRVVRRMKPWRISPWVRGARYVVELRGGGLSAAVEQGVRLEVRRV